MDGEQRYVALLRGINVGGHHKVPMAALRSEMESLGFENVETLLNSGNIIFDDAPDREGEIEKETAAHLEEVFGFSIPVLVRRAETIRELLDADPFADIEVNRETRLYVTFLKELPSARITLPWVAEDGSYRIVDIRERNVCCVLDLSMTKTPKVMNALEQLFGKGITTRNWKTVTRIAGKL